MNGGRLKFGEGYISGVISLTLGILGCLATLCFLFPGILTTPDIVAGLDQTVGLPVAGIGI